MMELYKRGFVLAYILLATLHLFICDPLVSDNAAVREAGEIGEDLADTVDKLYASETMRKVIAPSSDGKPVSNVASIARNKVKEMVTTTKLGLTGKDEKTSELVGNAIGNSMKGLVGMVNGIKNSNWVEGVQGALGLVAAVVSLAGPGIGTIIAAVLSAVSTFLGLFGGSQPESQEGMVKRVVETAISESRNKDLKEDVEGVQHVYQSLSTAIQQFREAKELSSYQADQLYMTVFHELNVFGRLKTRIAELCAKCDTDIKAGNCIDFAKLYAELSILRQLIMTDLASLLFELGQKLRKTKLKSKVQSGLSLDASAQNILKIIRKEQENDLKTLSFLGSPISHPRQRWAFAIMFAQPEKFSTLISYLNTLDETNNFGFWDDSLIICNDNMLQGECVAFERLTSPKVQFVRGFHKTFDNNILSFFVPPLGEVEFTTSGYGAKFGPFKGPALHGGAENKKFRSLEYKGIKKDNKLRIRFCEGPSFNASQQCDFWEVSENKKFETSLKSYKGKNWVGKIGSFYVPPGLSLEALSESGDKFGPYIGPHFFNQICDTTDEKKSWEKVTIERASVDGRSMIEFCDKEDLKGACFKSTETLKTLTQIYGQCDFTKKIKSIKIPAGYSVQAFENQHDDWLIAGTYIGPVTIGKVDNDDKWGKIIVTDVAASSGNARTLNEDALPESNSFKFQQKETDWKAFDRNETRHEQVRSHKKVHKKHGI